MPTGRHLKPSVRRSRRLRRTAVPASLGVLAALTLASGSPSPEMPDAAMLDDVAPVLLDGRGEVVAGRSDARDDVAAEPAEVPTTNAPAAPRPVFGQGPDAPLPEVTDELYASSAVNVRSGPSTEDEVLTTLDRGETIDVTGEIEGAWAEVVWDERVAWVSADYLQEDEPEPEPETPQGVSSAACATSPGIESSLAANAAAAYRAVCAAFPGVASAYGGYRPGDGGDHGSGHALDIMVSGQAGWDIAAYLQAHAGELGITYLIYQQQIWMAGSSAGAWEYMADRGSPTANHYDHVHVSTY